jgi:nicotinate dehydrogenase subunit A
MPNPPRISASARFSSMTGLSEQYPSQLEALQSVTSCVHSHSVRPGTRGFYNCRMPAVTLLVNGTPHRVTIQPQDRLLPVLRDRLGLTGTKYGCGEGQCGACTVLVGQRAVRSCLTAAQSVAHQPITTIEGLEQDGAVSAVQQAFLDVEAFQCGYCTPGMIVSATALLRATPHPDRAQIVRAMNGNICRCGTYPRIIEAVEAAAAACTMPVRTAR